MLEWLAASTGVELSKLILEQVLDLGKPVLEGYVQDFFKDCLDSGIARLNASTLKAPMAEGIGYFVKRFVRELQINDVPATSIEHHYKATIKQFVKNKAIGPILGQAFERDCRQINYEQLEHIWTQQYEVADWQFPAEEFDWRGVSKEYVYEVKGIIKANAELRSLLETELLEDIARNTAQLSPGFDFETYRASLQTSYGYLKLYTLDSTYQVEAVKLWAMFIEQTVREALPPLRYELPSDLKRELQKKGHIENDLSPEALKQYRHKYFQQPARKVLEAVANSQRAVILGDPGSGKSSLLQYLALEWVEDETEILPLLIELREFAIDPAANFLEFLHRGRGVDWQFDQHQLHQQLLESPTLVMFDGLDEVFDYTIQSTVVDGIIRFSQKYPKARILVTSRIIGYNPERLQQSRFQHFTIQSLDPEEIHEFIDRWYDLSMSRDPDKVRLKQRLKDAIANSQSIANLADNPLLLTMMAILNRRQELEL
ncbi:MAG: NACHT domain-containing protein [Cyanobacteria bacterium J06560_5]